MAEAERWQVSTGAAEVYESCFVPAIFEAWAGPVADAVGIKRVTKFSTLAAGQACSRERPSSGSDTKARSLALTSMRGCWRSQQEPSRKYEWRKGDAASLPFKDATFDVVISQFALMFFSDRLASLGQMWRVSRQPGALRLLSGRLSIAPAGIRFWWISRPGTAEMLRPVCWLRLSSLVIKPSSPTYLSTAEFGGQRCSP